MDVAELTKDEVRIRARAARQRLSADELRAAGAAVQQRLLALPEFRAAPRVALYVAMPGELETGLLAADCWRRGVPVCVPAFCRQRRAYDWAWWTAGGDLRPGPWGVREPYPPAWIGDLTPALAVVPGLGFDLKGGRVGHGGGHYDRLLAGRAAGAMRVGVALECQVFETVPCGEGDVRMDVVVTECRLIRVTDRSGAEGRREGL